MLAAAAVLIVGGLTGHVRKASADERRLLTGQVRGADVRRRAEPVHRPAAADPQPTTTPRSTFFLIGNKVAANPAGAKRIADAGMEVANHTWEHPNMTTIPPEDIRSQISKANDAIQAATGQRPKLLRTAGGLINDNVLAAAKQQGMADINWDVIPFDWVNDSNTAATRYMLMTQIKPGSVVLFHDTYSSTVDLVYQFIPVLQGQRLSLGDREPAPWVRANRAAPTAVGTTGRRSTTSPTFRPLRSRRCRTRRRPSRCRTSRSPISLTRTRADRTTAPS